MTKILIADDETNILMLLEIMLRDLDAEIISAENGEIAIQKAYEEKPDLIISDVVMPKKNGFEVCRAVRQHQDIEDIPIILLSALGDEYNKLTGFDEGADDYIIKPFNIDDLKEKTRNLLNRHKKKKDESTQTESNPQEEFISTGIEELDNKLFGGLPKGSNILLTGPIGSGKSSFSRKFVSSGLVNKEKVLFVAIDDDPKKIRQKLSEITERDTEIYEKNDQIRFIDAYSWSSLTPPENEPFLISGSLELNHLAGVISDASYEIGHTIQKKCGGRRVIDSISSLLINFDISAVQRFINQIARTAIAFGGVVSIFILEEGTVDETKMNNIKYIMDGVIEFKKEKDQKFCRIASMKWAKSSNTWIPL